MMLISSVFHSVSVPMTAAFNVSGSAARASSMNDTGVIEMLSAGISILINGRIRHRMVPVIKVIRFRRKNVVFRITSIYSDRNTVIYMLLFIIYNISPFIMVLFTSILDFSYERLQLVQIHLFLFYELRNDTRV